MRFSVKIYNLDFIIEKVIICTESFGSLLALGLTNIALKNNLRAPDILILIDPLINMKNSYWVYFQDDVNLNTTHSRYFSEHYDDLLINTSTENDKVKKNDLFPKIFIISTTDYPFEHSNRLSSTLKYFFIYLE